MKVFAVETGVEVTSFSRHGEVVTSVAFSPDGKLICSGSLDNTVRVFAVDTGIEITSFCSHTDHVTTVAFSPDGNFICSGSADNTVKVFEVKKSPEETHCNLRMEIARSRDGFVGSCVGKLHDESDGTAVSLLIES